MEKLKYVSYGGGGGGGGGGATGTCSPISFDAPHPIQPPTKCTPNINPPRAKTAKTAEAHMNK